MPNLKVCFSRIVGLFIASAAGGVAAEAFTKADQADLIACIRPLVWGGFDTPTTIQEICRDHLGQRRWSKSEAAWLDREISRQWAEKTIAEKLWPKETTFDRLDGVFVILNSSGIMALHNAGNTQSDGWDDARQLWDEKGGASSGLHGAVFYHGQDLERVLIDKTLLLTFGPFAGSKLSAMEIADRVVVALRGGGFTVKAPLSEDQRIEIMDIVWQKRGPR